jgi:hypothetical protein
METTLDNIEALFEKMNNDGFATNDYLKWGFYFFDNSKAVLIDLYKELENHGYKLESIDNEDKLFKMHVSKVEILSAVKLYKRNVAFNELANHFFTAIYDGWDVERVK